MKKYSIFISTISIIFTLIMLVLNSLLNNKLKNYKEIITVKEKENLSSKYIIDLCLQPSINIIDEKIFRANDDKSFYFKDVYFKYALIYFYSAKDCQSCVEENYQLLKSNFTLNDNIIIFILSNESKRNDILLKSKINTDSNIKFGLIKIDHIDNFMKIISKKKQSNTFYPIEGRSELTMEYIKTIKKIISKSESSQNVN